MENRLIGHKRRIGFSLGVMMVAVYISSFIFTLIAKKFGIDESPIMIYVINAISIYGFGYLAFKLMLIGIEKIEPQEKKKLGFGKLILLIIITIGLAQAANFVTQIILLVFRALTRIDVNNNVEDIIMNSSPLINFIFAVIIAPIFEELIMRGTLMKRIRVYGDKTAIIFTAIAFGLFHANIAQIPFAIACGLVLGYALVKTNSIIYSIIIHMALNGFAVLMQVFLANNIMIGQVAAVLFVFAAILFCMIFLPIRLSSGKVKVPNESKFNKTQLYENIGYFVTVCIISVLTIASAIIK